MSRPTRAKPIKDTPAYTPTPLAEHVPLGGPTPPQAPNVLINRLIFFALASLLRGLVWILFRLTRRPLHCHTVCHEVDAPVAPAVVEAEAPAVIEAEAPASENEMEAPASENEMEVDVSGAPAVVETEAPARFEGEAAAPEDDRVEPPFLTKIDKSWLEVKKIIELPPSAMRVRE